MTTEKLSITLPAKTLKFVDEYRKIHSLKSRADVIEVALAMLRETERESEISEAPEEDELEDVDLRDMEHRNGEIR